MKRILKEPLFHFLLIGAGLFLLYNIVNTEQTKNEIVIDNYLINELSTKWEMKRNREPSFEEMIGLVALYIEQEILYTEALFMNLDHNDEIIKRRLAQKMEFLSDDLAESLQPTEDMLQEYYKKNKENYAKPSVFTFKQVYFSENKRASAIEDAKIALENEQPENLGDHLYYPTQYTETDALKIATDFGYAFAASLDTLAIGKWSGPVRSGYGIHIVFIENKQPSGFYSYEEVSNRVNVDYNFHASKKFKKELIASLLTNYEISFDLDNRELKEELSERY